MKKTAFHSYKTGNLAKGCQLCVQGKKMVLFVTGLCSCRCYFCPISDQKKNKDVIYANEWPIKNFKNIIEEAKLCSSKGAGFTGGDPLVKIERTTKLIKLLKKTFGKKFHIHLYTPLNLINEKNLKKLHSAGLDEIRVHPDLDNKKLWNRIDLLKSKKFSTGLQPAVKHSVLYQGEKFLDSKKASRLSFESFNWKAGVEIPVVPGKKKQTISLIMFIKDKVDFLNLNELEISDSNASHLVEKGFKPKDDISYGVKGSETLAKELLKYCKNINVHYCTATLKDRVQLAKRIKRRAKNIAKPYDKVTSEGMLIRGAIYLPELAPSFGYRKRLGKKLPIAKLKKMKNKLKQIGINTDIDKKKARLLTSSSIVRKHKKQIKMLFLIPAIVTEYPTYDSFETDILFF